MILLLLILLILIPFFLNYKYKQTTYYKDTHNSWLSLMDKGKYGEYLTYKELKFLEKQDCKFLFNTYLDKGNGETTEMDVIAITPQGMFVFESKNYSGWIFGSEKSKTWTQTLPQGKSSKKEHFLNPIWQNKLHVETLKKYVGNIPHFSVIVFSERCELKKIETESVPVIKRDRLYYTVKSILKQNPVVLSQEQIDAIYQKLYQFTQVEDRVKEQHVENIKNNINGENNSLRYCPRCGSELVLRTATKGENKGNQFWGCSNFPKCRYIEKE